MSLNQVTLIGVVGTEPDFKLMGEIREPYLRLNILTTEEQSDLVGGTTTETDWHTVLAYGNMAKDIYEQIQRNSLISVVGMLKNNSFESGGRQYYVSEIKAQTIEVLANKKNEFAIPSMSHTSRQENTEEHNFVAKDPMIDEELSDAF